MTDCRPLSMFSLQTSQQLSEELGFEIDKRCFRANLYVDLNAGPFADEDELVGHSLQFGKKVKITILEVHDSKAGVYGAVLVEGIVRPGDELCC